MGKNISLNSSAWRDIVFEGRNKKYGAYELRESSSKRHIIAFITGIVVVALIILIPTFLAAVSANQEKTVGVEEAFELSNLDNPEEQVKEEDIIRQETAPPPPPLKATIQFTPPVITEDSKVKEDKEMKSIDELMDKKDTQIGKQTVEGTNDKNAIDPDELKDNKMIAPPKEPEKPFTSVEQMPQFPGGDAALMKFIAGNLKYPTIAAENGIEGRVVIRFVVDKDGNVSDAQILKTLDPSCDKEAIRVVKSMPRWVPGKQNGINVPVYYTLPVMFRLAK